MNVEMTESGSYEIIGIMAEWNNNRQKLIEPIILKEGDIIIKTIFIRRIFGNSFWYLYILTKVDETE